MSLAPDTRLGPYLIQAPLGVGGMGEVYRARDTRLDRIVAIKTLPADVSDNPERRTRFEREARAVAALTHPHICTLHDIGQYDGIDYLVMELLDGETLASRVARGPMPAPELVAVATQIAGALAAAHCQGIVHRDLKPANVMLTRTGAKLLDFGLAKLRGDDVPLLDGVTRTAGLTGQGQILGTLHYMAPEQLESKPVDARTDVFAFGLIVFEMATGRRAFEGSSQASLIGAILHTTPPPLSTLARDVPPALERLLANCLAKAPDDRWSSAHDVWLQLKSLDESTTAAMAASPGTNRRERWAWAAAAAATVAALVITALAFTGRLGAPPASAAKLEALSLLPPAGVRLSYGEAPQISPDGRHIAFVASDAGGRLWLYVRSRDKDDARPLPETDDATMPFWSPDSRRIGFFAQGQMKTVSVQGGTPQVLARTPVPRGGTWNRDGVILYVPVPSSPIMRIAASGGTPTPLPGPGVGRVGWFPVFLPDGRHYLYSSTSPTTRIRSLWVASTESAEVTEVVTTAASAVYAEPGYLLFRRETALVAQRFDPVTRTLSGTPVPVQDNIGFNPISYQVLLSTSADGVLVSLPSTRASQLVWFDREGRRTGIAAPPGHYNTLCLTNDDTRVVYDMADPDTANIDVWSLETKPGATPARLTFDRAVDFYPVCSPDGREVLFGTLRAGPPNIFRLLLSAPGNETLAVQSPRPKIPTDWSRDGRLIVYGELNQTTSWDVKIATIGGGDPVVFAGTDADERNGRLSPDGKWLAYVSSESSRPEVFVQPFPPTGAKWQVSKENGQQPQWQQDGKQLYYLAADRKIVSVNVVTTNGAFATGAARALVDARVAGGERTGQGCQYAVSKDGTRFLVSTAIDDVIPATVMLNWTAVVN